MHMDSGVLHKIFFWLRRCGRRLPAVLLVFLLAIVFLLNTATVRRRKSAVGRTQTDPIKLKDKMEEIKDGEKGPATPQFSWYGGGNGFMGKSPVGTRASVKPAKTKKPEAFDVTEVDDKSKLVPKKPEALPEKEDRGEAELWDEDQDEQISDEADNGEDTSAPAEESHVSGSEPESAASESKDKDWWEEI